MAWMCPNCKSTDLRVYFDDRRVAPIDHDVQDEPTPDFERDELVEGCTSTTVECNTCDAYDIEPLWAEPAPHDAWVREVPS